MVRAAPGDHDETHDSEQQTTRSCGRHQEMLAREAAAAAGGEEDLGRAVVHAEEFDIKSF